jgi:hypothetical protein
MEMTVEEQRDATVSVLEHLGKLVQDAQNENPTIGAVTLSFHNNGQFSIGFVGSLDKALTMGALLDTLLSFREMAASKEVGEHMTALVESLMIADKDKN